MSYAAVTASTLSEGDVVFWSHDAWVQRFADAQLFDDKTELNAVVARAQTQVTTVIDVYPIDVALDEGVPVPTSYRERVRALGPTIHPDMGKQAEGGPVILAMQSAHGGARSSGRLGLIKRK
jgi:sulfite reductase (NADPH) hemoprotein beta-component